MIYKKEIVDNILKLNLAHIFLLIILFVNLLKLIHLHVNITIVSHIEMVLIIAI